jgi:hypothetical protein
MNSAALPPSPDFAEQQPPTATSYEQSMHQLFGLLDATPSQDALPRYYTVEWDEEDSTRITNVTVMTATPTGARRQERFGEFYQAQFHITERWGASDETQRFIWCATGARRHGTPIEPDLRALEQEHAYEPFHIDTVVGLLARRAQSIDDHIALARLMHSHDIRAIPELTENINKWIVQFVYGGPAHRSLERDSLFELLRICRSLGSEMPRWAQGNLISRLVQAASGQRIVPKGDTSQDANQVAANAMATLEAAISQGVITDDPYNMQHILINAPLYKYPYATTLLHAELQNMTHSRRPTIFGVDRVAFAYNYIVQRFRAENTQVLAPVAAYLHTSALSGFAKKDAAELHHLLDKIVAAVDGPEDNLPPMLGGLSDAPHTFAYILSRLHSRESATSEAQAQFDQQCVEVVRAILGPVMHKQLGEQAVKNT